MRCPNCKVEMDRVINYYGNSSHGVLEVETPYYKCPKCKQEGTDNELEEEDGKINM